VVEGELPVGHLWIAETGVDGFRSVFIYDVRLREDARGRGVGRRVMELAEDVARRLGARDLELHVFAPNARARRLYESLGYRSTSLGMRKTLGWTYFGSRRYLTAASRAALEILRARSASTCNRSA